MRIIVLICMLVVVGCGKKEKDKTEEPKQSALSCLYTEEATATLMTDNAGFEENHSFCFTPAEDLVQEVNSCTEGKGKITTACQIDFDVECPSEIGTTYYYGPNWTKEFCG